MNKKHQVAIIGYGWAATAHIAAINATTNAEVCAIWSSRPLDSGELNAKHGGRITAYTDLAKMLASPDVIIGSACAVTETGSLVFASASGSQLTGYAGGSARVILVVRPDKVNTPNSIWRR